MITNTNHSELETHYKGVKPKVFFLSRKLSQERIYSIVLKFFAHVRCAHDLLHTSGCKSRPVSCSYTEELKQKTKAAAFDRMKAIWKENASVPTYFLQGRQFHRLHGLGADVAEALQLPPEPSCFFP